MVGLYDILITATNHPPSNDIEALVYVIFSCALYTMGLISILYLITIISQIFSRR